MYIKEKKIIVAVSGGIATYKLCEFVRLLCKEGASVRVAMTKAATKFVSPLTFETLTGYDVFHEMFPNHFVATKHIDWADWADAVVVAPATANLIGKLANGISNDIVTTIICAFSGAKLIAPAMNTNMWKNTIVQDNIVKLKQHGFDFVNPEHGDLACGWVGEGRLAENNNILGALLRVLEKPILKGKRVLISSGPTTEEIDPVRFLSNRSTGKMGHALAFAAWCLSAKVVLVTGPTDEKTPHGVKCIRVRSAAEMNEKIKSEIPYCDMYLSAAAVSDYTPVVVQTKKLKKTDENYSLELKRTEDILLNIPRTSKQKIIGFAVETDLSEERAIAKMKSKKLDAIILNNPKDFGSGFAHETNVATLFFKDNRKIKFPIQKKKELAFNILKAL